MISNKYYVPSLVIALSIVLGSCQGQKKTSADIIDIFRAVPSENLFGLSESAIDSLVAQGHYTDPEGDEFESVVYDFVANDSTVASTTLSFSTGQSGFVTVQLKTFPHSNGGLVVIYSKYGGATSSFEQHELKRFDYGDAGLIETDLGELPVSINSSEFYKEGTPDSEKHDLNTGYKMDTEDQNTIEFFAYSALMDFGEPTYFTKLIYKWDGKKFIRSGFSD